MGSPKKRVIWVFIIAFVLIASMVFWFFIVNHSIFPQLSENWQVYLIWIAGAIGLAIAVLAGIAEFTGYNLKDLFSVIEWGANKRPKQEKPKTLSNALESELSERKLINILSPEKNSPAKIGGWLPLTGTFEKTLPQNRVKLFKRPLEGNRYYWPELDVKIDFKCGNDGERKWCANIPVRDNKPGLEVEYIVAILGDEGLAEWQSHKNLPDDERYGMQTLPTDTIVCARLTVIVV